MGLHTMPELLALGSFPRFLPCASLAADSWLLFPVSALRKLGCWSLAPFPGFRPAQAWLGIGFTRRRGLYRIFLLPDTKNAFFPTKFS